MQRLAMLLTTLIFALAASVMLSACTQRRAIPGQGTPTPTGETGSASEETPTPSPGGTASANEGTPEPFPGEVAISTTVPADIPQAVLNGLPVFPGSATPTQDALIPDSRLEIPVCGKGPCPTVYTATSRWEAGAPDEAIQQWYHDRLIPAGYQRDVKLVGEGTILAYFHPQQPDVQVEIDAYLQARI